MRTYGLRQCKKVLCMLLALAIFSLDCAWAQDALAPVTRAGEVKQSEVQARARATLENAYRDIFITTEGMVNNQSRPSPLQNSAQYAIGLIVDNFSEEIRGRLLEITQRLKGIFSQDKPALDIVPPDLFHTTLFVVVRGRPWEEVNESTPRLNEEMVRKVSEIFNSVGPIEIRFRGINLGPDGGVFVEGYVEDENIFELREKLSEAYPDPRRSSRLVHITIGRITREVSAEEFRRLYEEVLTFRDVEIGRVEVTQAKLVSVRDRFGFDRERESVIAKIPHENQTSVAQVNIEAGGQLAQQELGAML